MNNTHENGFDSSSDGKGRNDHNKLQIGLRN